MNVRVHEESIDNCFWLGKSRGKRPLLVRFTRVVTREEILDKAKMLKGLKIWIERDSDFVTRNVRRELLPYLREARRNGKRAVLKFDRLKVEDQIYDLEYCRQNLKKEEVSTNPLRRSNSQNLQEEGRENSGVARAKSSRRHSPEWNSRSQRERHTVESAQRGNE